MKNLGLLLFIISPLFVSSQKIFEGKIVYKVSIPEEDSMIVYYSQGKMRTEFHSQSKELSNSSSYFLSDFINNNYYSVDDIKKTITRIIIDSAVNSGFTRPGKRIQIDTIRTIQGFRCYGESEIKNDTFSIVNENDLIIKSKVNYWFAKDLYYPYETLDYFKYLSTVQNQNICLLIEIGIVTDQSSTNQSAIKASKIEQTRLPATLFELPTNYEIKEAMAADLFQTRLKITDVKITDVKLSNLDSIPPPPPPELLKSPDKKARKQKSGNN